MRYVLAVFVICLSTFIEGCSSTKIIALHSETKMAIGEHLSCMYHADKLFCASPLLKAGDIDKLQLMNKVVAVVHSEEKEGDMKEGGTFSTRFTNKPKEYSIFDCSSTGVANPAVECSILREADQKLVANQEGQIKLGELEKERQTRFNESDEKQLQSGLTEQDVVAKCGLPVERTHDSISHTIYFRSVQAGQEVEVRFSTLRKPTQLDHIESVRQDKGHEFIPSGILWSNYSDIGKTDEDRVADVRRDFPCILK